MSNIVQLGLFAEINWQPATALAKQQVVYLLPAKTSETRSERRARLKQHTTTILPSQGIIELPASEQQRILNACAQTRQNISKQDTLGRFVFDGVMKNRFGQVVIVMRSVLLGRDITVVVGRNGELLPGGPNFAYIHSKKDYERLPGYDLLWARQDSDYWQDCDTNSYPQDSQTANPSTKPGPGSLHGSAPNPHYYCDKCGRDLWSKYDRLRNPNGCPCVNVTLDGRNLCDTCFYKEPVSYICAVCEQKVTKDIIHQDGKQFHEECHTRLQAYQDKVERRYARLSAAAERAQAEAQALERRAQDMASIIPFGQPILVGHHSEKADRRYRDRIHNTFDRAYQQYKRSEELKRRSESRRRGISSDDPAAAIKLREKLEKLEHNQTEFKRINAAVRKLTKGKVYLVAVIAPQLAQEIGVSEATATNLLTPDFLGRVGIPDYELRNNGAEIRRLKARIEQLSKQRTESGSTEVQHGDIRIVKNVEANRLQIFFPGKPSKEVIRSLKQHGFKYAITFGAWQRMLNNGAEWNAYHALKSAGIEIPEPK